MDIIVLGLRIKKIRKLKKLTQEKLAELINVSPHYIYEIEKGMKSMSLSTLVDISTVLNISTDYLLFGKQMQNGDDLNLDQLETLLQSLSPQKRDHIAQVLLAIIPYIK